MPKYRARPVIIEARLFDIGIDYDEACNIVNWAGGTANEEGFTIPTLEGVMQASSGDYIIKGTKGEFYPCKPDIFEKKYEKIEE